MATKLKDVAMLANVSITTASHALNGKAVNEDTKNRVLEAAKKLNYHKSIIGRNLITNRSNTIGMFILNSKSSRDMTEEISYYYRMIMGVLSSAQRHGYLFNFEVQYWEDIKHNEFIEQKVLSRSIDGMILIPQFTYSYDFLSVLEKESFPYVIINPNTEIKPASKAIIDNFEGGYMAANYLLEIGHKDLFFINGPRNHIDSISRENGFFMKLIEDGVKFNREKITYSDFTSEGGYYAMKQVLDFCDSIPTAIFCANDYMAAGALRAIFDRGLRVPEDISLIGYDDTDIAKTVYPRLTTIAAPIKELGFIVAERVFEMIDNKIQEPALSQIVMKPELVVRESTRKLI